MEDSVIVLAACRQRKEVFGSFRTEFAEELQLHIAVSGVERHRHSIIITGQSIIIAGKIL